MPSITITINRSTRTVNAPAVAATRTRIIGDVARNLVGHPKALLVAEGGATFVFPLAPLSTEHDGYAPTFGEVPREGRKGLTYIAGVPLETLTFSCTLRSPRTDPNGQISIEEDLLVPLRKTVAAAPRFALERMGFTERGWWACDGMKVQPTRRQHGTNLITRATVTFSFLEWAPSPTTVKVGPATGGAQTPAAVSAPPAAAAPASAQTYVVAAGDTLIRIATRFYGRPDRWRDIATANRLPNPNRIVPGQRLVIPR